MNNAQKPLGTGTDQALGKIDKAVDVAQTGYDQMAEGVRRSADQAGEFANRAVDAGSHYLDQGNRALSREIERSPLTAVAIAALFGFVLGSVLQRRN